MEVGEALCNPVKTFTLRNANMTSGGHSICPGRFLAKHVIVFTCALLTRDYDIEMLSDRLEMDSWRFGLGVGSIKHALPFRIRRRCS
jgi:hypothetical protein